MLLIGAGVFAAASVGAALAPTALAVVAWRGLIGVDAAMIAPSTISLIRSMFRAVVAATLTPPPKKLGVTHWSSRLLAARLGIGNATVARAWRDYGVQPWRAETFKFSTDPELVGKVTDVVGLYLAPPENAVVLCVDEKSQIQALDRTDSGQANLPVGGHFLSLLADS